MKDFVFFYAWQSDRLERLNRHLIRFAGARPSHAEPIQELPNDVYFGEQRPSYGNGPQ
jgi:hypothetical protein